MHVHITCSMVTKSALCVLLWALSSGFPGSCFGSFGCTTFLHPKMWTLEFFEARIDLNCIDSRWSNLYLP